MILTFFVSYQLTQTLFVHFAVTVFQLVQEQPEKYAHFLHYTPNWPSRPWELDYDIDCSGLRCVSKSKVRKFEGRG
jgi:hypothetical protein